MEVLGGVLIAFIIIALIVLGANGFLKVHEFFDSGAGTGCIWTVIILAVLGFAIFLASGPEIFRTEQNPTARTSKIIGGVLIGIILLFGILFLVITLEEKKKNK